VQNRRIIIDDKDSASGTLNSAHSHQATLAILD